VNATIEQSPCATTEKSACALLQIWSAQYASSSWRRGYGTFFACVEAVAPNFAAQVVKFSPRRAFHRRSGNCRSLAGFASRRISVVKKLFAMKLLKT
jgi:hypothetical protein